MRTKHLTIALSAIAISALGFAAAAEQKAPSKTATPTAVTVYKTPT